MVKVKVGQVWAHELISGVVKITAIQDGKRAYLDASLSPDPVRFGCMTLNDLNEPQFPCWKLLQDVEGEDV